MSYGHFAVDKFHRLQVSVGSSSLVSSYRECALSCVDNPPCSSFNLASSPRSDGKYRCELLNEDKYSANPGQFVSSQEYHHFSIKTPCSSFPCQNGAKCVPNYSENDYHCDCVPGYIGRYCETDINECASDPCLNGATCVDQVNGYVCNCQPGYTGVNCQTDINECSSNPCLHGATCVDQVNGYVCNCLAGYTGVNCQTDIDECASDPCLNGATCVDQVNGYVCNCQLGYVGVHCQTTPIVTVTSSCANLLIEQTDTSGIIFSTYISNYSYGSGADDYFYSDNMDCNWSFSSNTKLELTFFTFSTQLDADYLYVYDGGSTASPLIGTFSGTSLPMTITSSSNKLHVRFTTDSSGTARGFRASYRALTEATIRLVESGTPLTGRVEVFHNGQWGTVCSDGWDINDARVVCKQLGFSQATQAFTSASHGQGSGPIWMDDVACSGGESFLHECSHSRWGINDCTHSQDASVQCTYGSSLVRLVNGGASHGRVEVYYNETWGTVCDDIWNFHNAGVICRQLGFSGALSAPCCAAYGEGADPIWLDNVNCGGDEASLDDCPHAEWGKHNCKHHEDASVVCYT
ncbi:hypothetical protein ACROYT_G039941 [Oculina patagonica]